MKYPHGQVVYRSAVNDRSMEDVVIPSPALKPPSVAPIAAIVEAAWGVEDDTIVACKRDPIWAARLIEKAYGIGGKLGLIEELRRNAEDAVLSRFREVEPGVRVDPMRGACGMYWVTGEAWRQLKADRSQREQFLGDECGRLRDELTDALRDRDRAQAEVYRLTKKR